MEKPEAKKSAGVRPIIFIVEDDPFLLSVYQTKFAKEGYEVWFAADGQQALEFLKGPRPNLVMLDIMLPWVNGFDVLQAMRANAQWKNVPVIILTNLSNEHDVQRGKQLGAADYIIKANSKISDIIARVKQIVATQ